MRIVDGALVEVVKSYLFPSFSSFQCVFSQYNCNQAIHLLTKHALVIHNFHVYICNISFIAY